MTKKISKKNIKFAVVGYGPAFNHGKRHCQLISNTENLSLVSVCDLDTTRTEIAKKDFPGISTYNNLDDLLREEDFDAATIVTPPNTHAKLAIQCLKEDKHVVVEKPMTIKAQESIDMIKESRKRNLMLSVFHNRRFDGNYLAIKETIEKGLIGKVFRIEAFYGGFRNPPPSWRSNMNLSGGIFYDWGSHCIDWILNLHPQNIKGVYGFSRKFVWEYSTTEDEVEAIILFEDGAIADLQGSTIASIRKPAWRILGTRGGIIDPYPTTERVRPTSFQAIICKDVEGKKPPQHQPGIGRRIPPTPVQESKRIEYKPAGKDGPAGWHHYYINIANHLLKGEELKIKPEEAAKVISIIEAAKKSSNSGKMEQIQAI